MHYYRHAKSQIDLEDVHKREADLARQRFTKKNERLKTKSAGGKTGSGKNQGQGTMDAKKAYVQGALARTRAKRRDRTSRED